MFPGEYWQYWGGQLYAVHMKVIQSHIENKL